jgi:hypothetical protein
MDPPAKRFAAADPAAKRVAAAGARRRAVHAGTNRTSSDTVLRTRRRTATLVGLATLAAVIVVLIALTVQANDGTFTYIIDDPYIHLSMARNLAMHGTYGVVPGAYESASSSPGWVGILAALIRVAPGAAEWFPLSFNLLAAAGVLVLVLRAQSFLFTLPHALLRGVAYVLLPIALYLPALVLLGMEHTLHALLVVALLLMLHRALQRRLTRNELIGLAALALVAGAIRYETLFVAGGAALALLVVPAAPLRTTLARLRRPEIWAFLLPPLLVTAALGAVNLAHGQYLLPNSVLAKSGLGAGQGLAGWLPAPRAVVDALSSDVQVLALLGAGLAYLLLRRTRGVQSGLWVAWCAAALVHAAYAKFGWYDRYQGYLVISGTLLVLRSLPEVPPLAARRLVPAAAAALVLLAALPLPKLDEQIHTPQAAHTVYGNQYEMGRFLAAAFPGQTVMVNDIGEVSWQHSGGLIDIWALGSYDVLHAYRTGAMGKAFVADIAEREGVQVAAVYGVLHTYIPDSWVEVARWPAAGVAGAPRDDHDIVFYAPSPGQAAVLRTKLEQFAR